jgi:outer membrane biosynthesis protein TonB
MRSIALALLFGLAVSACTHAKAKTALDNPALDVPLPPEHDVEPVESEPLPPVPLPQEPARNTPARPRPTTQPPPAREQPRAEAPKPEPPKPEPAPVVEQPKIEEAPRPPSTLQTMPTTAEGEAERTIRAALQRANNDLSRVDYRALNSDARNQYDTAKRIMRQADDAIRAKNLVYAKTLADKAASLAAQLAGR